MLWERCPVCPPVCNIDVLWPNGCLDQDATWYGGRPWTRWHYVRWRPSSSAPQKRGTAAPTFLVYFALEWSLISATAELLLFTGRMSFLSLNHSCQGTEVTQNTNQWPFLSSFTAGLLSEGSLLRLLALSVNNKRDTDRHLMSSYTRQSG